MKKNITKEFIVCDKCGSNLGNEYKIKLRGFDWDLCHTCAHELNRVLSFLEYVVGFNIKWKESDNKKVSNG